MDIFVRGINTLPNDILRDAVLEKYASAERSYLRLLLATWNLEETKCRVHTQEQILCFLETTHSLTELEYKYWMEMYTDRGLPELKDNVLLHGNQIPSIAQDADRDGGELTMMVQQARERGIDLDSFDDELKGHEDDVGSSVDLDFGQGMAGAG